MGEMFEGDFADTGAENLSVKTMGGRAEGLACANSGARTPIGVSENFGSLLHYFTDFQVFQVV